MREINIQEQNMKELPNLLQKYLSEAENTFGPRTDYVFEGLSYHNYAPQTILSKSSLFLEKNAFIIKLNGQSTQDKKDCIFQLSHEVVHLISPVEQKEDDEVNYLEEGMATYFSKIITDRETGDIEYAEQAIMKEPKYFKAYQLYKSLILIDKGAVKKLRIFTPIIANINPEDFHSAGIDADEKLIEELLCKFT